MATATAIKHCEFCSCLATHGNRCVDCLNVVQCVTCGDLEDNDKAINGVCRSCRVECVDCGYPRHECPQRGCCNDQYDESAKWDDDAEPLGVDVEDIDF